MTFESMNMPEIEPDTELFELLELADFTNVEREYKGRPIIISTYFDQPDVTEGLPQLRDELKQLAGKENRNEDEEVRYQMLFDMLQGGAAHFLGIEKNEKGKWVEKQVAREAADS